MPRAAISVLALVGIVLWGFCLAAGGHRIRDKAAAAQTLSTDDLAEMSADSAEADAILSQETADAGWPAPDMESRAVRPATAGDAATAADASAMPLERIAAREQPTPPPAAPPKPVTLSRPVTRSAGIVSVAGRTLQFAGLIPTDPKRRCRQSNGLDWPCGAMAATAQRQFIRGRTLACDLPKDWADGSAATCRIGDIDIGDWLAAGGWAEASAGSALTASSEEARKAGKGLFGTDPRRAGDNSADPQ